MALFSFGKKDKNPPEAAAPVAKATPTPPKIQNPPAAGVIPAVKPPQPAGLIPATGGHGGAATTQPMVMPRGAAGLKPARPGVAQSSRSTQRIVLPSGGLGAKPNNTKPLSAAAPTGRINLPIGMILRCLPQEVLASDLAEFEASGAAATEIGLPMNMILSQLPSGKVEMPLSDLIPHFPPGYLQPTESIASYLPNLINLPLMDVVMRISPDLLALRPDQKDVDAAVINMADPFTEEILREQAEAARRAQTQTNIIEESQAPQEEFVPQAQAPAPKTIAPPPRPQSGMLPGPRPTPPVAAVPTPPAPQTSRLPAPPMPGGARNTGPVVPPSPSMSARMISPSGRLPAPTRATTAIPARPQAAAVTSQIAAPTQPPLVPPAVPRQTASVPTPPIPPTPRQTGALPAVSAVPRQTVSIPSPVRPPAPVASVPIPTAPPAEPVPVVAPGVPDASADELQRLAALAMQQLGEDNAEPATEVPAEAPATAPLASIPVQEKPVTAPIPPAPVSVAPPPPKPEPVQAPVAPAPVPVAATPTPAPQPQPVAVKKEVEPAPQPASVPSAGVAFNLNTCSAQDLVQNIPGCFIELAESIIQHRNKIGSYKRIEDLLDVPGMNKAAYTNLTGEEPPENRIPLSLNELLGFPIDQHISLKDVTDRIACWPDVTGCVLSQSSGLSLVGNAPEGLDKAAIVAFAPRMFDALNKSFEEITGKETDAIILPTPGTSFHIFRNKELYLIIMSRLPQMPERHMKVARFVLSALSIRRD